MIKLLFPLPKKLVVAFSGGVDSVAIADFLRRKHDVTLAFFHHGTKTSELAHTFVQNFAGARELPLVVGHLTKPYPDGVSSQEFWRDERYKFLESFKDPVVTAHHLDDCVETYVWSCMHGNPKVIPAQRNNVLRPFLTTTKHDLIDWAERHECGWIEDQSNTDTKYIRNYIRHEMLPHALHVNPGLPKLVKKLVLDKQKLANTANNSI
jgi:tRNA(Ile)-lysidine synthase